MSLGAQTAYGINPARDFGPRLALSAIGYSGVWNYRNQYWLWVEWAATIPGGIVGGLLYDALIYSGSDSPLNKPWEFSDLGRRWRRAPPADRALDEPEAKQNMPAGNAGSKV